MFAGRHKVQALSLSLLLSCVVSFPVIAQEPHLLGEVQDFFLSEKSNTPLFILLLLFLPLVGAPMTLFCLLAGSKFGTGWGTLAIALAMLWHLTLCYWLMQSFFKRWIMEFIQNRFQTIPDFSPDRQLTYSVSLMAVPVLPYMVKNIVVASAHFGYFRYLLITLPIQLLFSLPFIMLTGAVHRQNFQMIWIAAIAFILLWLSMRWFQTKLRNASRTEK